MSETARTHALMRRLRSVITETWTEWSVAYEYTAGVTHIATVKARTLKEAKAILAHARPHATVKGGMSASLRKLQETRAAQLETPRVHPADYLNSYYESLEG